MCVAHSEEVSRNSKGHFLTFVNEGYPFAGSNVDGTVHTVDDIEWPDFWVNENLRILASNYP